MIERIAAEYQSGTSSVRLAGRYGIGKGTVLRLLRQNGLAIRRRGPR
jgi:ABC-type transport system involved in cytochrome c biogenesis ATPase subunit